MKTTTMNKMFALFSTGLMALTLSACGGPNTPSGTDDDTSWACASDARFKVEGEDYCLVKKSIIEKGFLCPNDLQFLHPIPGGGAACSGKKMLPPWIGGHFKYRLASVSEDPNCPGPDPSIPVCAADADCGDGYECVDDTTSGACISSSCSCDMAGGWTCTADCGTPKICKEKAASMEPKGNGQPKMCGNEQNPAWQECSMDEHCPTGETCQPSPQNNCVPSNCGCTDMGVSQCTADCGQAMRCAPPQDNRMCQGEDPSKQECDANNPCPNGGTCVDDANNMMACVPSGCSCGMDGNWVCTEDCNPKKTCVNTPTCQGEDPSKQECDVNNPCPNGGTCVDDANNMMACVPSGCSCGMDGNWVCTEDCNPKKTCVAPLMEPQGNGQPKMCGNDQNPAWQECATDEHCPGTQKCLPSATQVCVPSNCGCTDMGVGQCTADCGMAMACAEPNNGNTCQGEDPSKQECDANNPCSNGERCYESDAQVCVPSSCSCGMDGNWICTADCGAPLECSAPPTPDLCNGVTDPSFNECTVDSECGLGFQCLPTPQAVCVPSNCTCDMQAGWQCDQDCGTQYACAPKN